MATRVKAGAAKAGKVAKHPAGKAAAAARSGAPEKEVPSRNPMTNLIIADIALRSGGRLLRHVVERTLLGVTYPPDKARKIVKGRGMARTLIGTAVARVATRSVPGALLVGGGLLAKTLYDRSRKRGEAEAEGAQEVDQQARDA
jgi:hypothetical protein